MGQNVLVIAGEVSGDHLGAQIIQEWKKLPGKIPLFWGIAGEELQAEGVSSFAGIDDVATIGIWEGVKNYMRLKSLAQKIVQEARQNHTDYALLVDFPGFNLAIAAMLHKAGIPCYQVVSPTIWLWNYKRIYKIKKYIQSVLCLYHFEAEIYHEKQIDAHFIGHPVIDKTLKAKKELPKTLKDFRQKSGLPEKKELSIALLPGSRKSEIDRHLQLILDTAAIIHNRHPNTRFYIPPATPAISALLEKANLPQYITVTPTGKPEIPLSFCHVALACSGTVTMECALYEVPYLLFYKTSQLTYRIGKLILNTEYIGIVNIILKRNVAREFIQHEATPEAMAQETEELLFNEKRRKNLADDFVDFKKELGKGGAAKRAAIFFAKL